MEPIFGLCDIQTIATMRLLCKDTYNMLQSFHLDRAVQRSTNHAFVKAVMDVHEIRDPRDVTWSACVGLYNELNRPESCHSVVILKRLYRTSSHNHFLSKHFFVFLAPSDRNMVTRIHDNVRYLYMQGERCGFTRSSFELFVDVVNKWALWCKRHKLQNESTKLMEYRSIIHLYYNVYGLTVAYKAISALDSISNKRKSMVKCWG